MSESTSKKVSIFKFNDYKSFILYIIEKRIVKDLTRAYLAKILNCHGAYISMVLNGNAHLSLEQAQRFSKFLKLHHHEVQYFLLLLQLERAGTPELRNHLLEEKARIIQGQRLLKNRVPICLTLSEEAQSIYYNSWLYGAIHVALTVPQLNNEFVLSKYFNVSPGKVRRVLRFLESHGIAKKFYETSPPTYGLGTTSVHLGSDSPHITKHHSNWRLKCVEMLETSDPENQNLHYSGVFSISSSTATIIRERLTEEIKKCLEEIKDAKDDEVMALNIDFFGFGTHL